MRDLYYVCYQAHPIGQITNLPDDISGAVIKGYINAMTISEATNKIEKRMKDLGWEVNYLEDIELFNMEDFDTELHQPVVVQKAMEGKIAVDIEYWCESDLVEDH